MAQFEYTDDDGIMKDTYFSCAFPLDIAVENKDFWYDVTDA